MQIIHGAIHGRDWIKNLNIILPITTEIKLAFQKGLKLTEDKNISIKTFSCGQRIKERLFKIFVRIQNSSQVIDKMLRVLRTKLSNRI